MRAIQTIIEEYKNRNPEGRLHLFLQYPDLRQVFEQIDNDEIGTECEGLSNSQQRHMTPQAFLPYCFAGLHNSIKSIFRNDINAKKKEKGD